MTMNNKGELQELWDTKDRGQHADGKIQFLSTYPSVRHHLLIKYNELVGAMDSSKRTVVQTGSNFNIAWTISIQIDFFFHLQSSLDIPCWPHLRG